MSLSEIISRELTGRLVLSSAQLAALEEHFRLLRLWNARMNLTTVTELPEAAVRHYCESLFLSSYLEPGLIADVGSGAGFPGLVCAVARPDCKFVLIESHQRKSVFLKEASRMMANVEVAGTRADHVDRLFDCVISRAVDPAEVLSLRIARTFKLLMGEADIRPGWNAEVVRLPWGSRRVLVSVSRGTDWEKRTL